MNNVKESFLNDVKKGSGDTSNASNETTSTTNTATTHANSTTNTTTSDTYIYGVGILAVLGVAVMAFLVEISQLSRSLIDIKMFLDLRILQHKSCSAMAFHFDRGLKCFTFQWLKSRWDQ